MTPNYLTTQIHDSLATGDFSETNANIVSRHLVDAERRGVSSHGINRLDLYLSEAANDVIDPKVEPIATAPRNGLQKALLPLDSNPIEKLLFINCLIN